MVTIVCSFASALFPLLLFQSFPCTLLGTALRSSALQRDAYAHLQSFTRDQFEAHAAGVDDQLKGLQAVGTRVMCCLECVDDESILMLTFG